VGVDGLLDDDPVTGVSDARATTGNQGEGGDLPNCVPGPGRVEAQHRITAAADSCLSKRLCPHAAWHSLAANRGAKDASGGPPPLCLPNVGLPNAAARQRRSFIESCCPPADAHTLRRAERGHRPLSRSWLVLINEKCRDFLVAE
jgi:hypothetical protein